MLFTSAVRSFLLALVFVSMHRDGHSTIARCQANCASPARRVGPRQPRTRPHPWSIAPFPTTFMGFCDLGCQLFFSEQPTNSSCKRACDYFYRYRVTVDYSDLIEQGINECFDGCDIALLTCQTGYYCRDGGMLPCPPGTYRENQTDDTVSSCVGCPLGRYRPNDKGTSADTCSKCPKGKYAALIGGTSVESCIRCPAGTVAEEEGASLAAVEVVCHHIVIVTRFVYYAYLRYGCVQEHHHFQ
jgi:hypothetical protein